MTAFTKKVLPIFNRAIEDYHVYDNIDQVMESPFEDVFESMLYKKCWIDTVQWHYEDVIRDPDISPEGALVIKRKIDASNQDRTDMVEQLDDYFLNHIAGQPSDNARLNTETPAWAVDRLSILQLKIYHMQEEVDRPDAPDEHRKKCEHKLNVLKEQNDDLSQSIDQLITDIAEGRVKMKLYRQMKMYNDPSLNPVLYKKEN